MLNPQGLDPAARAAAFAQYGQQTSSAGLQYGGLQGGMQSIQVGRGLGLQTGQSAAAQQTPQQRLAAGGFQQMQGFQQQLGLGQLQQRAALGGAGLANGALSAAGNQQAILQQAAQQQRLAGNAAQINQQLAAAARAQPYMQTAALGQHQLAQTAANMNAAGLLPNRMQALQQGRAAGLPLQNPTAGLNTANLNLIGLGGGGAGSSTDNALLQLLKQDRTRIATQQQYAAATNAAAVQNNLAAQVSAAQQVGLHGLQDQDTLSFDNTDFPSLSSAARQGANAAARAGLADGAALGMGADIYSNLALRKAGAAAAGGHNEFSIQSEDFPALSGGGQRPDGGLGGFPAALQQAQRNYLLNNAAQHAVQADGLNGPIAGSEYERMLRLQQAGLASAAKGAVDSNASIAAKPAAPVDKFGLMGLLPLIKMAHDDHTMLALGTDLTGLGLNLNSQENLHKTFVSPLSDNPIKPEPEFDLPACYKFPPQRLHPGYLTKFKDETLFYMFYSMPGDEAQLIAADELSSRGWFYHKRYKVWMTSPANSPPLRGPRSERGSYVIFDLGLWDVITKPDLEVLYEDKETAPNLNRVKQGQQAAATQRH